MDFATGAPGWIVLDTVCSTILAVEDGFAVSKTWDSVFGGLEVLTPFGVVFLR